MSYRVVHTVATMNATLDFIRQEEAPPLPVPLESPLWKFEVQCLACGSYQIGLQTEFDEDTGESTIWLACIRCQHLEKIPARSWNFFKTD